MVDVCSHPPENPESAPVGLPCTAGEGSRRDVPRAVPGPCCAHERGNDSEPIGRPIASPRFGDGAAGLRVPAAGFGVKAVAERGRPEAPRGSPCREPEEAGGHVVGFVPQTRGAQGAQQTGGLLLVLLRKGTEPGQQGVIG